MNRDRLLRLSHRWFALLLKLYPDDFRDDMGEALVEAYRDRARAAIAGGGVVLLAGVWLRALVDALRNGTGEWIRPAAAWRRAGNWRRDAVFATRRLLRAPASAAIIVATLAIGLGMFAVVHTAVYRILIEPLPYRHPDDLYMVWRDYRPAVDLHRGWLAGTDLAELQKSDGVIEGAAALTRQPGIFSLGEGTNATEIAVMVTSPNLFDLLGVAPALGRGFHAAEVGPGRPAVIVLTHGLWTRFGARHDLVGADVRLNGEPYTVIGIMPEAFDFMRPSSLGSAVGADAYVPLNVHLAETDPTDGNYGGLIRVRRDTPPATVGAAVEAVGRIVDARDFDGRGPKLYPVGLKSDLTSRVRPALLVVGVAGVFLLLVLAVNLATVLLARAAQREHEFAVARALGASGGAVARATIVEGGLLGLMGGAAGTLWAWWATHAIAALVPLYVPRRDALVLDWHIAAVVVIIGMVLGLAAAVLPATWAARSTLSALLASGAVRGGGGRGRMRRGLVVSQVALSLVLLTAAGLVVRSFERLLRIDPGFQSEGIVAVRVTIAPQLVPDMSEVLRLQERTQQALSSLPGVAAVSAADALPLTASAPQTQVSFPGAPGNRGDADRDAPLVDVISARPGYLELMGVRVIAGRPFDTIRPKGVREAVIDRQLAMQFFPIGDPLGASIAFRGNTLTVIGVVEQARMYDLHADGRAQIFIRGDEWSHRRPAFVLRTERSLQTLVPDIRMAVRQVDPRLALGDVELMDDVVGRALSQQRVSAVLIASFALGALVLAGMGLYGVMSGLVTRRRHELAVRLALGADHAQVARVIIGEGARLVGLGILLGGPGVYVAGHLLAGVLVGVSPLDPLTLVFVALGLVTVAMTACYAPARRVLRIEPAQALRDS